VLLRRIADLYRLSLPARVFIPAYKDSDAMATSGTAMMTNPNRGALSSIVLLLMPDQTAAPVDCSG
jgi:hypothetical protein